MVFELLFKNELETLPAVSDPLNLIKCPFRYGLSIHVMFECYSSSVFGNVTIKTWKVIPTFVQSVPGPQYLLIVASWFCYISDTPNGHQHTSLHPLH